jgi:hypothetical protein
MNFAQIWSMAMQGTYEEQLKLIKNGKLVVTASRWSIQFYFPGPDARYNGTSLHIAGADVRDYIEAYLENWKEYHSLKGLIPKGGAFQKEGKKNMSINIGSSGIYGDGVCIYRWYMPINKLKDLEALVSCFWECIEKAEEIMQWLKTHDYPSKAGGADAPPP